MHGWGVTRVTRVLQASNYFFFEYHTSLGPKWLGIAGRIIKMADGGSWAWTEWTRGADRGHQVGEQAQKLGPVWAWPRSKGGPKAVVFPSSPFSPRGISKRRAPPALSPGRCFGQTRNSVQMRTADPGCATLQSCYTDSTTARAHAGRWTGAALPIPRGRHTAGITA